MSATKNIFLFFISIFSLSILIWYYAKIELPELKRMLKKKEEEKKIKVDWSKVEFDSASFKKLLKALFLIACIVAIYLLFKNIINNPLPWISASLVISLPIIIILLYAIHKSR